MTLQYISWGERWKQNVMGEWEFPQSRSRCERHDWIPITEIGQELQINLLWEKLCQFLSPKLLLATDSIWGLNLIYVFLPVDCIMASSPQCMVMTWVAQQDRSHHHCIPAPTWRMVCSTGESWWIVAKQLPLVSENSSLMTTFQIATPMLL